MPIIINNKSDEILLSFEQSLIKLLFDQR